jgi:small subunit ribosomal protein S1
MAGSVVVELGEGIRAMCPVEVEVVEEKSSGSGGVDLSALSSLLSAQWKGAGTAAKKKAEPLAVGQVRSFKIVALDVEASRIELKLG